MGKRIRLMLVNISDGQYMFCILKSLFDLFFTLLNRDPDKFPKASGYSYRNTLAIHSYARIFTK